MPELLNVQRYGDALWLLFDDGSKKQAVPTSGDVWVVQDPGSAPVPPPPPPDPGGGAFSFPYPTSAITSEYGPRDPIWTGTGWTSSFHRGTDFGQGRLNLGDNPPVPAIGAGVIRGIFDDGDFGFGRHVYINHGSTSQGNVWSIYAHLETVLVSLNQAVTARQTIGLMGTTGYSTGTHLHLETHIAGGMPYWDVNGANSSRNPVILIPLLVSG